FDPPRFISRLLGMGDLESLLEKAQEAIDEEAAEGLAKKMMSGKFTLHEYYEQIEMLGKMGPAQKLLRMIPGASDRMKEGELEGTQGKLRRFLHIMDSMTDAEMTEPKSVKSTRVTRIARGASVTPRDVKDRLQHYEMRRQPIKGCAGEQGADRFLRAQLFQQLLRDLVAHRVRVPLRDDLEPVGARGECDVIAHALRGADPLAELVRADGDLRGEVQARHLRVAHPRGVDEGHPAGRVPDGEDEAVLLLLVGDRDDVRGLRE